jgi:hypothetical protein
MPQSVWGRAWSDTERFRQSNRFFWLCEVAGAAVLVAAATYLLVDADTSRFWAAAIPAMGLVLGLAIAYVAIFSVYVLLAPWRLLNEERQDTRVAKEKWQSDRAILQAGLDAIKQAQERALPNLHCQLERDHRGYFLRVRNQGGSAGLSAQWRVISGLNFFHPPVWSDLYSGIWEQSQRSTTQLPQGHSDRLRIAGLDYSPGGLLVSSAKIPYFDEPNNQPGYFGTTSWGVLHDGGDIPADIEVELTISTDPPLPGGPLVRRYRIAGRLEHLVTEVT